MYADLAAHPHTLAVRPAQDAYRSMPGTPMGMEPRGSHSMDLAAAMSHARSGLERAGASDYFHGAPQYPGGAMRPRSPMMPLPMHDSYHGNGLTMNGNHSNALGFRERDRERDLKEDIRLISGLVLIFVEIPLLLRICPTSEKFDVFIRRFTTNYMRAGMYAVMSLIQWLTLVTNRTTSLLAAAVFLLLAGVCYLIAGLKGQGFVGSKTLGGQGVSQMIV
ncbi:MAG: hypothetical protein Q9221_005298 [Calogaya cf. arnoldii]